MKRIIIICFLLLACCQINVLAQDEITEELSGDAPAPGDVPVDGGLSLLLAAGAAYGVRRLHRSTKRK